MSKFEVINTVSGLTLGVYEADSALSAIAEMMADAGCDDEPSNELIARAV